MGFKLNWNQLADIYAKNLKVFSFTKFILTQLSYLEMCKSLISLMLCLPLISVFSYGMDHPTVKNCV